MQSPPEVQAACHVFRFFLCVKLVLITPRSFAKQLMIFSNWFNLQNEAYRKEIL
jgi:hypothetical protein